MSTPQHLDVLIVGAGLSGIGAAYRLQTERPGTTFAILEAREAMGGTWDLFRYPGVRSDSDMYTLGYAFRPWSGDKTLADGASILQYIQETAAETGVDQHIQYSSKVVGADFDTTTSQWTVTVEDVVTGKRRTLTAGFLYSCAGYYDYENPHSPEFAGAEAFDGQIVHPQFWPEDLDHSGQKVVVIGSGATAVTLVPSMLEGDSSGAGAAAHVTMLQRTPTWISAVPTYDKKAALLKSVLPDALADKAIRAKNIGFMMTTYQFCQRFPNAARKVLSGNVAQFIGQEQTTAHFTPSYNPWDQRVCAVPGGDLFKAVRRGDATVVTDHIDRFIPEGIRLQSGTVIEADIIVTATGLKLLAFGGIEPSVDGEEVTLSDEYVWNGAMVTGVPNFAVCIGYTNASWTLRADLTHRLVCKVLAWMNGKDHAAVVPRVDGDLRAQPLLDLASGYVQRSIGSFPQQGDRRPWQVVQNYVLDSVFALRADLDKTLVPVASRTSVRRPAA
ncbi:flavin-containing monooxygenase [Aeromicrobium sp. CF3.5]|uniref:flavin-containing monooxygenase n=1 Tax=Aeromicrobium sp. CF3.5 TaxID=3373078 RepID=UPI003EE6934E